MPTRYKCPCGNSNDFEVVRTVRTKVFRHFGLGKDDGFNDEDSEVLRDVIESVTCIVCNGQAEEVPTESATTE